MLDWPDWIETVHILEVLWVIPSCVGLAYTLLVLWWGWGTFSRLRQQINDQPTVYRAWGPRWNFSVLLMVTMAFFGMAWTLSIGMGVLEMVTPPPISEPVRESRVWFALLYILRDILFVAGQIVLWSAFRVLVGYSVVPRWMEIRARLVGLEVENARSWGPRTEDVPDRIPPSTRTPR